MIQILSKKLGFYLLEKYFQRLIFFGGTLLFLVLRNHKSERRFSRRQYASCTVSQRWQEPYRRYTARRGNKESYKTWRCRGHANGSGCRNRHIEETELLPGIADELNADVETLSAETVACVERITVEDIGVTVVLREKQESA